MNYTKRTNIFMVIIWAVVLFLVFNEVTSKNQHPIDNEIKKFLDTP